MTPETFFDNKISLYCGDNREALKHIADCSVDSIVTDPPYALVSIVKRFANTKESDNTKTSERVRGRVDGYARLSGGGFMGAKWDTGETAFAVGFWAECLRAALKPGGHVIAFSGTRTYHRMACAITAKADADDRLGSKHPTVKPVDLMQWLIRLVTPKGGIVLDPFAGTGSTAEACFREGMRCVLIERETEYQADIRRRMALCLAGPDERARESIKAKMAGKPVDAGPLFAGTDTPPAGQTDLRNLRGRTGRTIGPIGLKR